MSERCRRCGSDCERCCASGGDSAARRCRSASQRGCSRGLPRRSVAEVSRSADGLLRRRRRPAGRGLHASTFAAAGEWAPRFLRVQPSASTAARTRANVPGCSSAMVYGSGSGVAGARRRRELLRAERRAPRRAGRSALRTARHRSRWPPSLRRRSSCAATCRITASGPSCSRTRRSACRMSVAVCFESSSLSSVLRPSPGGLFGCREFRSRPARACSAPRRA